MYKGVHQHADDIIRDDIVYIIDTADKNIMVAR